MTPFCEAIHERLQIAMGAADKLMESNGEFTEEIEEVRENLAKSGNERTGKNPNPGLALKQLLAKWSEEPHYTQSDLNKYRNELWISLEEFERFLK